MSKRHNKSEDSGLPDWADDVTPADEVMRKFYAPTGAFKRGPINIPASTEHPGTPTATPERDQLNTEIKEVAAPAELEPINITEAPTPAQNNTSDTGSRPLESTVDSISDSAGDEIPKLEPVRRINSRIARRRPGTKLNSTSEATASTFDEFSRRWKRYLYPGQLSVMRVLFAKTVEAGMSECFTRYSELAEETKMTRRNCINVMNSLVDHGFVERLEVLNDATGKGIKLRVHPEPRD